MTESKLPSAPLTKLRTHLLFIGAEGVAHLLCLMDTDPALELRSPLGSPWLVLNPLFLQACVRQVVYREGPSAHQVTVAKSRSPGATYADEPALGGFGGDEFGLLNQPLGIWKPTESLMKASSRTRVYLHLPFDAFWGGDDVKPMGREVLPHRLPVVAIRDYGTDPITLGDFGEFSHHGGGLERGPRLGGYLMHLGQAVISAIVLDGY